MAAFEALGIQLIGAISEQARQDLPVNSSEGISP